jgi:hypothetical protein
MVFLRGVVAAGDLEDVEAELSLEVRGRIIAVGDLIAEFAAEFGEENRDGFINRDRVAFDVRSVMGDGSEGEGVLVKIAGFVDESLDKISGADIVDEVTEELTAERIVPEVLDDAASIRVRVGFEEIVFGSIGGSFLERRFEGVGPDGVDDGFVGEDRVGSGVVRKDTEEAEQPQELAHVYITAGVGPEC